MPSSAPSPRRDIAWQPKEAGAYRAMAALCSASAEVSPALDWWRRAAAIDPVCVASRLSLAEAAVRGRDAERTTRLLNGVLALQPTIPDQLFRLAWLLKAAGVPAVSRIVYSRLLSVD